MTGTLERAADPDPRTETRPGTSRTATMAYPLIAGVVAFAVGSYRLGNRELWNDEFATWHASTLALGDLRMLIGNIDLVHGFYYAIMRLWIAVVGDSPAQLRLLSVLAISLTAVVITVIGRRLYDTLVAVTAGLLFAVLPMASRYAQEARSYALVTLAAVVATWLLLRALDRPSAPRWWLYGVSLVVVGWLHFVALLVVAGHVVYVGWSQRPADERRWQFAAVLGYAALPVIPLLVFASRQSGQISWVKGDWQAVQRLVGELLGNPTMVIVAVGLAGLGVLWSRATHRAAAWLLVVWAVLPPIVGYATFTWLHLFMARYFLFTVPAWAMLIAVGVVYLGRMVGRQRAAVGAVVAAALAVVSIAYLGLPAQRQHRQGQLDGQPSYVSALRYIAEHARPSDGIAFNDGFGASTDLARKVTDYELRGDARPRDVFLARAAARRGWLTATECAEPVSCLGDTSTIWLIETGHRTDPFDGLPEAKATLLRDQFRIVHVENFDRVRVITLERTPTHARG